MNIFKTAKKSSILPSNFLKGFEKEKEKINEEKKRKKQEKKERERIELIYLYWIAVQENIAGIKKDLDGNENK